MRARRPVVPRLSLPKVSRPRPRHYVGAVAAVAVWLPGRAGRRADDLPQQQPDAGAGHPRRRAAAVARRLRRAAHRAGAARRTPAHRRPDRRRHHPRQDRRDLGRRAAPALRLHRQPARGPDRQGTRGARRHGRVGGAARCARRAGPAGDLVAGRQATTRRAGPATPASSGCSRWRWCSRSRRCCGGSRGKATRRRVARGPGLDAAGGRSSAPTCRCPTRWPTSRCSAT